MRRKLFKIPPNSIRTLGERLLSGQMGEQEFLSVASMLPTNFISQPASALTQREHKSLSSASRANLWKDEILQELIASSKETAHSIAEQAEYFDSAPSSEEKSIQKQKTVLTHIENWLGKFFSQPPEFLPIPTVENQEGNPSARKFRIYYNFESNQTSIARITDFGGKNLMRFTELHMHKNFFTSTDSEAEKPFLETLSSAAHETTHILQIAAELDGRFPILKQGKHISFPETPAKRELQAYRNQIRFEAALTGLAPSRFISGETDFEI